MAMSKRQFIELARIIKTAKACAASGMEAHSCINGIEIAIANMCASENTAFRRATFANACEYLPNGWDSVDTSVA